MPDRIRKINSKIIRFFKIKKTVFVLPKINKRKVKMSFRKGQAQGLSFLKPGFRRQSIKTQNTKIQITNKTQNLFGRLKIVFGNLFGLCAFRSCVLKVKAIFTNKVYLRKTFATLTIIAVIVTAYFQNTPMASTAT